MYSMVKTAIVRGLDCVFIQVEANVSDGMPMFEMVGFLSSEVKEARERVRTALQNNGHKLPAKRITINLSPAYVRKSGSGCDLSIAVAILAALGEVDSAVLQDAVILGEIGLNGKILPIHGILPIVAKVKEDGIKNCILPSGNQAEASLIPGVNLWAFSNLRELVRCLKGEQYQKKPFYGKKESGPKEGEPDFSEINGQKAYAGCSRSRESLWTGGRSARRTIRSARTGYVGEAPFQSRGRSAWPIMGCCFWMSFPSIKSLRWKFYASRWRTGRSRWRGSQGLTAIRQILCWRLR